MRCRRCIYTLLRHNVFCTCASNDRHFRDRSPLFEALERLLQPLEHEMQRQARNARTLKVDRFAASRVAAVSVASTSALSSSGTKGENARNDALCLLLLQAACAAELHPHPHLHLV